MLNSIPSIMSWWPTFQVAEGTALTDLFLGEEISR